MTAQSTEVVNYGADSIRVLSDPEHVRTRYGMYIGDALDPSHLFSEAMDNALDEAQSGYSDITYVNVDTTHNIYTIEDRGRGIPIGKVKIDDDSDRTIEAVQLLCTKSFSGAKFNSAQYKLRGGLHGVGLVVINALSEWMEIRTRRNGIEVSITTSKGKIVELSGYEPTDKPNGVTISFKPDPEIFESVSIPLDHIISRCKIATAFNLPVELTINNKKYDFNGIKLSDLVPIDKNLSIYHTFELEARLPNGEFARGIVSYTSETSHKYSAYTNLIYNKNGGTHVNTFHYAIRDAWLPFFKGTILNEWDMLTGVRGLIAVFIEEPLFTSQTKDQLSTKSTYMSDLFKGLSNDLYRQLEEDPKVREALLKRFTEYREAQNRLLARKEISSLLIIDNSKSDTVRRRSVVEKLTECSSPSRADTDLFIVEGESAAGSAKAARNTKTQAVLPIRGKILNVSNVTLKEALENEDIRNIINSIGAGVGDECDPSRSRYSKIIALVDADPDGKNIAALIICALVNLAGPLVKAGMLYVAEPPLYGYYNKAGDFIGVNTKDELPEGVSFTRYKGLGTMSPMELRVSCMDPNTRRIVQVEYPTDKNLMNEIFSSSSEKYKILESLGVVKNMRGV